MSVRVFPALRSLNMRSVPVIRQGSTIDRCEPKSDTKNSDANEQLTQTETPLKTLIIGHFCRNELHFTIITIIINFDRLFHNEKLFLS